MNRGDTVYIKSHKSISVDKNGYIISVTTNGGFYVIFSTVKCYDTVYLMNPKELFTTRIVLIETEQKNIFFNEKYFM